MSAPSTTSELSAPVHQRSWAPTKAFWRRLIVVLGLLAPFLIRGWVLSKVPEIDVPFDIDEFCHVEFQPGENAFEHFREAHRLKEVIEANYVAKDVKFPWPDYDAVMANGWSVATDHLKESLADYSEVIKVWQRGTECADGLYISPRDMDYSTLLPVVQSLRDFGRFVRCDGLRLESEGQMAEAAEGYLALLRSSNLVRRHNCLIAHLVGYALYANATESLVKWSEDSRVTIDQLRSVLDQVRIVNQNLEPPSAALKAEYLSTINSVKHYDWCQRIGLTEKFTKIEPYASTAMGAFCWILGEPEFTRRTVTQVLANQLPDIDKPKHKRAAVAGTGTVMLFEPRKTLGKNQLPPAAIDRAVQRSFVASQVMPAFKKFDSTLDRNQAKCIGLELTLIAQIYFREHGKFPADSSAFIPKYIDAWPVDPMHTSLEGPMDYQRESPTSARIRSQGSWGFDVTLQTR